MPASIQVASVRVLHRVARSLSWEDQELCDLKKNCGVESLLCYFEMIKMSSVHSYGGVLLWAKGGL